MIRDDDSCIEFPERLLTTSCQNYWYPDVDVYRKRMAALFWWVKQSGLLKVQKVPRSCKQVQRGASLVFRSNHFVARSMWSRGL